MYVEWDYDDLPRPTEHNILNDDNTHLWQWELKLHFTLRYAACDGHIFHDNLLSGASSKPVHPPVRQDSESSKQFSARQLEFQYRDEDAIEIVNMYLPKRWTICLQEGSTAKAAYDEMIFRYKQSRASEIHHLNQIFSDIRMKPEDTTCQYTEAFTAAYGKLGEVAEMYCEVHDLDIEKYKLPEGAAKLQLYRNTSDVEWLDSWRDHVVLELEKMDIWRLAQHLRRQRDFEYEERDCIRCKCHRHKNGECFVRHPELDTRDEAGRGERQNKRKRVR
jgi:hypothetical protein